MTTRLLLIISLTTLLSACDFSSNKNSEDVVELVMWITYKGPEYEKFQEITRQFSENYYKKHGKRVKISGKRVPYDDMATYVRNACMAGANPDIARIDALKVLELAYHKVLIPLDTLDNFDAKSIDEKGEQYMEPPFSTNVVEIKNQRGRLKRHLYGLPEQTTCLSLFWNKSLFDQRAKELRNAGLDPNRAPKTWDELIDYGKILTYTDENGERVFGFAMRNSLWWTLPYFGCYGTSFIESDHLGKKKCLLGDKRSCAALQLKVDLYAAHKIEAGAWKSGAIGPEIGFANKKYAMMLMGPWKVEEFRKSKLRFGVDLIPGIGEKRAKELGIKAPRSATNLGGNDLVIFKNCRHPEIAYEFINFLTSYRVQRDWCLDLKQIPVNRQALETLEKGRELLFTLNVDCKERLDAGKLPDEFYKKLGQSGFPVPAKDARVELKNGWLISGKHAKYLVTPGEQSLKVYRTYDVDSVIRTFMIQSKYAILPPSLPRYSTIETDIVNPEMELALKGVKSVEDAMRDAGKKIDDDILAEINR